MKNETMVQRHGVPNLRRRPQGRSLSKQAAVTAGHVLILSLTVWQMVDGWLLLKGAKLECTVRETACSMDCRSQTEQKK
jgi:hypothetical protein